MKKMIKKLVSAVLTMCLIISTFAYFPSEIEITYAEETASSGSIAVDINGSENRGALKSPEFSDWTLTGNKSPATYTENGVTFTLTASSGAFSKSENKTLIGTYSPYLTTDGAYIETSGTSISLKISGLSAGKHTITTWHSYYKDKATVLGEIGTLALSINGEVKSTVVPSVQVTNDLDAGISYFDFDVKAGEDVEILIKAADGSNGFACPVINAFEIDGTHPTLAITDPVPAQNEGHHDPAEGLSWTAADGAAKHDVYFGTDEYTVANATTASSEYKGRQTATAYAFTEELSHMQDYYWRVDEVDASGNVVKGKVYHFQVRHLAFPTAEGYGRFAKAGRGGYVYEVTTLEDNGQEGSLRYGIETLKGARIIVFKVGGVISLKSRLIIPADGGNVYVAGQTAPGDGITLINYDFGAMGASDVVIRNVRVRIGDMSGGSLGGMGLGSCDHSIVDHCSIAWSVDEGFSSRMAHNITFQYNIIAEALNNSVHYNGTHAFAASISGKIGSFHHNLLTNCTGRNWSLAGAVESDNVTYGGSLDISNNVVYNYRNRTTDGGVRRLNFVNNYYKMGASSRDMYIVSIDGDQLGTGDCQMMYVSGNMLVKKDGTPILKATDDAWAKGYAKAGNWGTEAKCKSTVPFFENYITLESAEDAYETVLEKAGAIYPKRDYLDTRYIEEAKTGTYTYKGSKDGLLGIIDSQKDAGGYPDSSKFAGGTAPNDSDHDGMPDTWETEHELDPNNAADGSIISLSAEGYTNVEMYLNELMGDPLVWADGDVVIPTATATVKPTATATATHDPTATPEPATGISGTLIANLDVKDETYKEFFSIDPSLAVGDTVFGDRANTFVTIDESLIGAEYILTACDSKKTTTDIAVVTAAKDIVLSVGFDARLENVPSWAADFIKTDKTCVGNNDVIFEIYQKEVKAGESITLGSQGQSSGVQGYIAMATLASGSVDPTETPAPSENPTDTPVPSDDPTDTPVPSDDPTDTPVPSDDPTDTPVPSDDPTDPPVPTSHPEIMYGDVDADGDIDAADALLVLKHAAKLEILAEDACIRGNVDGVEALDAADALWILKYAARLEDKFLVEEQETVDPTDVPETIEPTDTPAPTETATPVPTATATPVPTETATPVPTESAAPEIESTALEVKSTNDAATVENGIITFVETASTNGVLMSNPFAGKDLEEGGTISFWFTPSAETTAAGLLTIVNNKSLSQFMRFNDNGTLQFRDSSSSQIYNVWSVDDKFVAGKTYFMTCVMSAEGMKYYADGEPIAITATSGNPGLKNENQVNAAIIPLITNAETEIYIGGTTNIWDAMSPHTSHALVKDTVVKDATAYMDAMTDEEVKALYNEVAGNPVETPDVSGDLLPFSGTVYIAGDSIADGLDNRNVTDTDIVGWGNIMANYFTSDVTINNQANAGDSTESYYYNGNGSRYKAIYNNIKADDYVIISFGHNDGPGNPWRDNVDLGDSDTKGTFQWYIKNIFIEPALAAGATPILMTPVVRCFYENGVFTEEDYHLEYAQAYRDLVAEYAEKGITIPLIDAQQYTYDLYQTLSEAEALKYHATNDTTHYNQAGCERLCEYMIEYFKSNNMGIVQYIK